MAAAPLVPLPQALGYAFNPAARCHAQRARVLKAASGGASSSSSSSSSSGGGGASAPAPVIYWMSRDQRFKSMMGAIVGAIVGAMMGAIVGAIGGGVLGSLLLGSLRDQMQPLGDRLRRLPGDGALGRCARTPVPHVDGPRATQDEAVG
jgi:hypothetical protein